MNGRQLIVSERIGEQAGWAAGPAVAGLLRLELNVAELKLFGSFMHTLTRDRGKLEKRDKEETLSTTWKRYQT